ncbi:tail fiber domain-containing protein [Chitinimonas sp. BJB300]|uniref:tail fiber domain-containing protein n=1 Tax=Chitinimonas sp. BJB300 TaxID=1559339 RepID=UPI000C11C09F|nr:tail fiber domain-containing protein [Chitinimonas sp. BJB300]PHV10487.1 hypothetical protein CSQ89_15875 [Chitinimonas sp. BJB300]TSJ89868.1 tail fiber domain-containing protein [Chitinimonas sp. BJB300]
MAVLKRHLTAFAMQGTSNTKNYKGLKVKKAGFTMALCLFLSMLTAVNAAEADKEKEKKESPYANCGWNCLGWVWSDQNLKNTIEPLENVSGTIGHLSAYTYRWNDSGIKTLGLIAQNVEQADPRLVQTTESGFKQVNFPGVVALLLAEVKSLRAEVNGLRVQQVQ